MGQTLFFFKKSLKFFFHALCCYMSPHPICYLLPRHILKDLILDDALHPEGNGDHPQSLGICLAALQTVIESGGDMVDLARDDRVSGSMISKNLCPMLQPSSSAASSRDAGRL